MRTEKLQVSDIRYNPEHSAFEALVRIHDHGESYDYPTHVCAPLQAEFGLIARGLAEKAQRAHQSAHPKLRLRKAIAPVEIVSHTADAESELPLMLRILRARAA